MHGPTSTVTCSLAPLFDQLVLLSSAMRCAAQQWRQTLACPYLDIALTHGYGGPETRSRGATNSITFLTLTFTRIATKLNNTVLHWAADYLSGVIHDYNATNNILQKPPAPIWTPFGIIHRRSYDQCCHKIEIYQENSSLICILFSIEWLFC